MSTAPTPAPPSLRPIPRPFLERVSRHLLTRLLTPHEPALLARHDFSLPALSASAQTDRAHVDSLLRLLSAPHPDLASLHDDLLSIADVATRAGHELLLSHDTARALDHELGDEDCAAIAYLDHRPLFDRARPQAGQSQTRNFAAYAPVTPAPLPADPSRAAEFARLMSDDLEARGRTRYFKTHESRSGHERHFELVFGRLASARDLLGKTTPAATHDVTAQVTDRTTERAHAVFHDDTLRLDVAGHDWVKEVVRRSFGQAYFGSESHFEGDETNTLAPLANLQSALSIADVPGMKKVELQQVCVDLPGGWVAIGAKNDCTAGAPGGFAHRALGEGTPVEATFHLYLHLRTRPLPLVIGVPRKLVFDRRDPRVVRIVRDWVVARGYTSLPEHLRRSEVPGEAAPEIEIESQRAT